MEELQKKYDSKTLEIIEGYIEEFENNFGQYVSKEELISRIIDNLDNIEFDEEANAKLNSNGFYSSIDKKISIRPNLDDKEMKTVIFHEMTHCITTLQNGIGFERRYDELDGKYAGRGLNEGFVQYVTNIRDGEDEIIFGKKHYPILTGIVENFAKIIGKDKFFNIAFNKPQEFLSELTNMIPMPESIVEEMDIIYKYEKEMYTDYKEKRILAILFDLKSEKQDDMELKFSKERLLHDFSGFAQIVGFKDSNDFKEKMGILANLSSIMDTKLDEMDYYEILSNAVNSGISTEEITHIASEYSFVESIEQQESDEIEESIDISGLIEQYSIQEIDESDLEGAMDIIKRSYKNKEEVDKRIDYDDLDLDDF